MTTKVLAGERILLAPYDEPFEILPACESKTDGHWYCVKHKIGFSTSLDKDNHIKTSCRMAWICHEHGPEQP